MGASCIREPSPSKGIMVFSESGPTPRAADGRALPTGQSLDHMRDAQGHLPSWVEEGYMHYFESWYMDYYESLKNPSYNEHQDNPVAAAELAPRLLGQEASLQAGPQANSKNRKPKTTTWSRNPRLQQKLQRLDE